MSAGLRVCGLWFLALVVGCGGSRTFSLADSGKPPPHGGKLIFFADGTGLIEVVKKEGADPITAEVSFYFYEEDYTPYAPAPKAGVLVIDRNQEVALHAEGDALVTPPGPALFGDREVDGVLNVELDGERRSFPLGLR